MIDINAWEIIKIVLLLVILIVVWRLRVSLLSKLKQGVIETKKEQEEDSIEKLD